MDLTDEGLDPRRRDARAAAQRINDREPSRRTAPRGGGDTPQSLEAEMSSRTVSMSSSTAAAAKALLLVAALACGGGGGGGATKDTCVQVGPPQGFPLREADAFIATGHPHDTPDQITFLSFYGGELAGLTPTQYPQVCFDSHPPDRPNYRWVGWVDTFFYADGGQPPWNTYCADERDAGCGPQPAQLHGEVVMTLHEGANNVVVIPLSP